MRGCFSSRLSISAPTELAIAPAESLTGEEASGLTAWTARRLAHEPVARILGEREFWGLPFVLSAETLVPRPDTETIVETALSLVPTGTRLADRRSRHRLGLPARRPAA